MSASLFSELYEKASPFCLIDCRERRDFINGHWFGSTNIPLSTLPIRLPFLCPDREFPIHFLDWNSMASSAAYAYIEKLGYTNLTSHKTYSPSSSMIGYVRGEYVWSKAFGEIVSHQSDILEVTPKEFHSKYQSAQLIDVRPMTEYKKFTLPNSKNLPNSTLLSNFNELRKNQEMALLHCAGRTRSIIGAHTLMAAGFDGNFGILKGGTQAWELDGFERQHDAKDTISQTSETKKDVIDFLLRKQIETTYLSLSNLNHFIEKKIKYLKFDVSDDNASGYKVKNDIIKISGTNLVQQTDSVIAKYNVPIILFDTKSGSRAAFAAYWLTRMGFLVEVVIIDDDSFEFSPLKDSNEIKRTENLIVHWLTKKVPIFDFRPSKKYTKCQIKQSVWKNITCILNENPSKSPVGIISDYAATGEMIIEILTHHGWRIDGLCVWSDHKIKSDVPTSTGNFFERPIDKSALFFGRHNGNLQDAQDYLAWEENLPRLIPLSIKKIWSEKLK